MQGTRSYFVIAMAVAIAWHGLPAYAENGEGLCEPPNNNTANDGPLDSNFGGIVLMRHGKAPKDECSPLWQEAILDSCTTKRRRLCKTDKVGAMAEFLANEYEDREGGKYQVERVYSSQTCRAQETAYAFNLFGTHDRAGFEVNDGLNEVTWENEETRKRINEIDWINRAEEFIRSLNPKPGKLYVLVSHSDTIPCVLRRFGLRDVTPKQAKGVILHKTEKGFTEPRKIPP